MGQASVMESRPHHPRPRPHSSETETRLRPPLPRQRPLKSETKTETETQYFSCQIFFYTKNIIFSLRIFLLHEKHHFFQQSAFFMPLFSFVFSLGLVVSKEQSRARPRPLNLETETRTDASTVLIIGKIRSFQDYASTSKDPELIPGKNLCNALLETLNVTSVQCTINLSTLYRNACNNLMTNIVKSNLKVNAMQIESAENISRLLQVSNICYSKPCYGG